MLKNKKTITAKNLINMENNKFHIQNGEKVSWALDLHTLNFIEEKIKGKNFTTLETGMGMSTIVFGMHSKLHTAITPLQGEKESIVSFCNNNDISINVKFITKSTVNYLCKFKKKLDLVLIDGDHSFPIPMIEWHYIHPLLKPGGILILDDIKVKTCKILANFLTHEKEWKLIYKFNNRTLAFKKIKNYENQGWMYQPWYNKPDEF